MALIDDVRTALRVTSDMTDVEIQMWIDAAKVDMLRCGVKPELVNDKTMYPLVKSAITCFVKGQYGYDNSEAPRVLESYRMMLAALLNSKSNEYMFPTEQEEQQDTDTDPADDQDDGNDGGVTDGGEP